MHNGNVRSYSVGVEIGVLELLFLSMVVGGAARLHSPWLSVNDCGGICRRHTLCEANEWARLVLVQDSYRWLK